MTKITKKIVSLFLVLALLSATLVTAFAYTTESVDVVDFNIGFEQYSTIAVAANIEMDKKYTDFCGTDSLSCFIYDSKGIPVFNDKILDIYCFLPLDGDVSGIKLSIGFDPFERVKLNPLEKYTFVIAQGAFVTNEGTFSPEISIDFFPYEFIEIPAFTDIILDFLNSNWFLRILFSPLISIIEYLSFQRMF